MFIKFNEEKDEYILNVDSISSIVKKSDGYEVSMNNGHYFLLNEHQYRELCEILTKWL